MQSQKAESVKNRKVDKSKPKKITPVVNKMEPKVVTEGATGTIVMFIIISTCVAQRHLDTGILENYA